MSDLLEGALVVGLAAAVGYAIHRFFPDSRRQLGAGLDDALLRGGVRAAWFTAGLGAIAVVVAWLLL